MRVVSDGRGVQAPGAARDASSLASYALGLACVTGYLSGADVTSRSCGLTEFETRMERAKVMTGLCIPCASKAAGRKRATHGFNNANSRLHVTWANMKRRCLQPRGAEIQKYQGVMLCEEWMSFEPFMEWSLANGYTDQLTLDRIDASKGYEPGNCRYADYNVQAANRRLTDKNTSGHVGITWARGKWSAKVQWKKKQIHLGRFDEIKDAVKARNDYLDAHNLPHLRA